MPARQPVDDRRVESLDALKLDPFNRRKHGARNLDAIRASLDRLGPARSIVVDDDLNVLAGNGTVQAARDAGIANVVVVPVDRETLLAAQVRDLSDDDKRYLGLADNRTAELATWDLERLLADRDAGLPFDATLFTPVELDELLASLVEPVAPDEFKAYDESLATEHRCPACGYEWSGSS